jgi:hypothetical protein
MAIVATEIGLATAILLGLLVKDRWRSCYSFAVYLASFVVFEGAILAWPERFFRVDFWLAKEAIEGLLKLTVALEIAMRVFARLPTARLTFALAYLMVLFVIAVAVAPTVGANADTMISVGLPRLLYGTAVIFTGLLAVCLWYHVPLYPIHKAVLIGFVPYLVTFTIVLQLLETFGWDVRGWANYTNTIAFISLLAFWAVVAWRHFSPSNVSPTVITFLQPWVRARRA